MRNEDFFAQPAPQQAAPPPPPALPPSWPPSVPQQAAGPPTSYPVGARDQFGSYQPHEQAALASGRLASNRNMGYGHAPKLSFMDRLHRGLSLARTSGGVIATVPSLMVAPLLALLFGGAAVYATVQALGGFDALAGESNQVLALKLAPLGVILTIVSVLSQAVVIDGTTERLQLGQPRLGRSWGKALGHLPDLVAFATLSFLVTSLINLLRQNRLGNFIANRLDFGWDFATFFAVPVVLYENAGPLAAVKRSVTLARQRWAEQLVARGALSLALFVLSLPLLVLAVIIGATFGTAVFVALFVSLIMFLMVLSATLYGVLSAALYRYVVTGEVAPGFTQMDFNLLFQR